MLQTRNTDLVAKHFPSVQFSRPATVAFLVEVAGRLLILFAFKLE